MDVRQTRPRLAPLLLCVALVCALGAAHAQKKPPGSKPGKCTVTGKVTDLATGKAVAAFPLTVYIQQGSSRSALRAVTDRRGVYTASVPKGARVMVYFMPYDPEGKATFLIDESWLQQWRPRALTVARDATHDIKVKLEASREVKLTVNLPGGRPASGARVLIGRGLAVTGADGKASVNAPRKDAGLAVAAVSPDGTHGCTANLKPGATDLRLQLQALQTFTGTLTDTDGNPAEGVAVVGMPAIDNEAAYMILEPAETRTDAQGRFRIKGLQAAEWMINWEKGGGIKRGTATVAVKGAELEPVKAPRDVIDPALFKGSIGLSPETKLTQASCFALDPNDNILVCDEGRSRVLKVSPEDKLLAAWDLKFRPQAIAVRSDGSVLVGGDGQVAVLDSTGRLKVGGAVPGKRSVTAIAAEGSDVFVCAQGETGFAVYRMKDDLKEPKRIINNLSGCCGQMDITVHKGHIYAAENTRFSVGKYSIEGKKLADFVHSDAKKPEYYGEGCCEPKNLCIGPDGSIYTAASGKMEVKRYAADGKFLGAIGRLPDADGSCVRVTLGITKDSKRIYILDTENKAVRLVKQQ